MVSVWECWWYWIRDCLTLSCLVGCTVRIGLVAQLLSGPAPFEVVKRTFCFLCTLFEHFFSFLSDVIELTKVYSLYVYILWNSRKAVGKIRGWCCAFRACILAVYSLRLTKLYSQYLSPLYFLLFSVTPVREFSKHWDSRNLHTSASGVVGMC